METRKRNNPKLFTGVVIRAKLPKTVVVEVRTTVVAPKYKKYLRKRQRFNVHDGASVCRPGDRVEFVECRPLSRLKRWRVRKVLERVSKGERE